MVTRAQGCGNALGRIREVTGRFRASATAWFLLKKYDDADAHEDNQNTTGAVVSHSRQDAIPISW